MLVEDSDNYEFCLLFISMLSAKFGHKSAWLIIFTVADIFIFSRVILQSFAVQESVSHLTMRSKVSPKHSTANNSYKLNGKNLLYHIMFSMYLSASWFLGFFAKKFLPS